MLTQLVLVSLTCLGVCGALCLTVVKRAVPIMFEDAEAMWTLHRQNNYCTSKEWQPLQHRSKIIGFQCQCGYKYTQKKPIIC